MKSMNIVMPISIRDVNTIINNRSYFIENLPIKEIIVIGSAEVGKAIENIADLMFINENEIYPGLNYHRIQEIIENRTVSGRRRAGWYLQQFIKMAYCYKCEDECYLVWDSDTIPLRKLSFNKNDKLLYSLKNEFYEPYFEEIRILFPQIMQFNDKGSYITEHMVFDTNIMKEMIGEIEANNCIPGDSFFEKILNSIPVQNISLSGFSEFETYGTFVYNYYQNRYAYRQLNVMRHGKIYFGEKPTNQDLSWAKESYDTISFEHFEKEWMILSFFARKNAKSKKRTMREYDEKVGKYIELYHKLRRIIKELLRR